MYVQRNEQGVIVAVFSSLQEGYAEEFLPAKSKELAEFYKGLEE